MKTMLLDILSVASFLWAPFALCVAACVRRARAQPFVGTYDMLGTDLHARGGTVSISHNDNWSNLISSTPVLRILAEHGPGTLDWSGAVEVLGLSKITLLGVLTGRILETTEDTSEVASGFYWHLDQSGTSHGGTLRLLLSKDHKQITEYYVQQDRPSVRILKKHMGQSHQERTQ